MPQETQQPASPARRHAGVAALVIGSLTVVSRVLGLVRDMLFAASFFGPALDAFALAFTVPNLFRRLFGEGALASSLVPAFVEKLEAGDRPGASRLAARALGALIVLLGALTAVVVAVSILVAAIVGTNQKLGLVAGILAIVMPYVILICGAAVVMAYLNAARHYVAPAVAPILLNLALIAVAFVGDSVWWLAVAVLVGGVLQYAVQIVPARALGMALLPRFEFADKDLRRVGRRLLPTIVGLAAFQINVLLDRVIAETLIPGHGAVGALFLGSRLMQLPLAIFAIAIATSALTELSALASKNNHDGLRSALRDGVGSILFWTIPSTVGLALLAEPIVALLFDRGAFTAASDALPRTSLVVMFYAPGIVAFGVAGLYARAFYAKGDPATVVRAGLWSVAVNLGLNVALVLLFQRFSLRPGVEGAAASGEAGLALASSAGGVIYLAVLTSAFSSQKRVAWFTGAGRGAVAVVAAVVAALLTETALVSQPVCVAWNWMWNVPTLPTIICVGTFVAVAIALASADTGIWPSLGRTSVASLGMGIAANLVLSSLPPAGESYVIVIQRALAPVVLGAGAYWFLAGIVAVPEYTRARATLTRALARRRSKDAATPPDTSAG